MCIIPKDLARGSVELSGKRRRVLYTVRAAVVSTLFSQLLKTLLNARFEIDKPFSPGK